MFLFLFGDDTYRSREKLEAIKQKYLGATQSDLNLLTLDVENQPLTFEEFVRQAQAMPFLASSRLIIVKNLLSGGSKDLQDNIVDFLGKIPSSTVVIFYEHGVPDKRTRIFRHLNQSKIAQEFAPLSYPEIVRWIEDQVKNRAGKISRSAAEKLAAISDSNLWALSGEIDKLILYADLDEITAAMIEELVVPKLTASTFEILQAAFSGAKNKAVSILNTLFLNSEPPLKILGALIYQLRLAILLKKDLAPKISRLMAVPPFALYKNQQLSRYKSFEELKKIYADLGQIDFAVKTGKIEDKRALFLWLAKLTQK